MRTRGGCLAGRGALRARGAVGAVAVVLGAAVVLFVAPSSAMATRAHVFSFAFPETGSPGSGAGSMSLVPGDGETAGSGVAVDDVTHDVYVADTGNRRVDEFTDAGVFVRAWGWGVETGAAKLQVCTSSCRAGLSGSEPGEFEVPSYVAVDNSSSASHDDVYVGDTGDSLVTKFSAEGKLETSWGNNGESPSHKRTEPNGQLNGTPTDPFNAGFGDVQLSGISTDDTGDLIVLARTSQLFEFDDSGVWLTSCIVELAASAGVGGISIGGSGVFVLDGQGEVQHVGAGCGSPGLVTSGVLEARGVAVDRFDGDVYVDRSGGLVEDISVGCVPSPAGCAASQVLGDEDPFVLEEASGVGVDPGPGVVYVANAGTGQVAVFKLSIEATTGTAEEVHAHSVVLHGTVNPVGSELTHCTFEYGETESYGSSAPCTESPGSIGNGPSSVPVEAAITGLDGGKSYHFRLHAAN
jgi:DNA-binding beta-propeller fold protein YncE